MGLLFDLFTLGMLIVCVSKTPNPPERMSATAVYDRYAPSCVGGQLVALRALCALLERGFSLAASTDDRTPAEVLPCEWDSRSLDATLPCALQAPQSRGVISVKFVPMPGSVVALLSDGFSIPMMFAVSDGDATPAQTAQIQELARIARSRFVDTSAVAETEIDSAPRAPRDATRCDVLPPNPQTALPPGGFGELRPRSGGFSDLVPGGGAPGFGPSGFSTRPSRGGGMLIGPDSEVFRGQPGGSGFGGLRPGGAIGFGRYDPIHPGQRPVPGPGGINTFPGEPDPDHLRPPNNNGMPQFPTRGRGGVFGNNSWDGRYM